MPIIPGPNPRVVGSVGVRFQEQLMFLRRGALAFPRVEVLKDDFNASSLDTTKWTFDNTFPPPNGAFTSGGNMSQTGSGFVTLFATDTTAFNDYSKLNSGNYDFRGSSVYANMNMSSLAGTGEATMGLYIREGAPDGLPDTNFLGFTIDQTGASTQDFQRFAKLKTGNFFDDTTAPTTWTFATCAWLRLRESNGSVFWDRAPSTASNPPIESDWINIVSTASAGLSFDLSRVFVNLRRTTEAGALTNASDGTISIDAVNTNTGASGNTFNDSVTESATPADTPVAVTARAGALAETATPTEVEASLAVLGAAITETATPTPVVVGGLVLASAVTETATPTPATASAIAKTGAITDTGTVTDAVTATVASIFQGAIEESLILSDLFGTIGWFRADTSGAPGGWSAVDDAQTSGWTAPDTSNDPGWTKTP